MRLPRRGALGVHPSLLPRHRGPNPYYWAIDAGDAVTGVSAHWLTHEYDRGEVLLQEPLEVGHRDAWQLARALDRPSLRVLREVVAQAAAGRLESRPQDEALATWAPEPDGALLRADFAWPSERVLRRIRALAPVPGLALEIAGLRFFVTRAGPTTGCPEALYPGEAAVLRDPPRVAVRTGNGAIAIEAAVVPGDSEETAEGVVTAAELANLVAQNLVLDSAPEGLE